MQNIFDAKVAQSYINRINQLTPNAQPKWGKMSVAQMLAHCNQAYESILNPKSTPKANWMMKWVLKKFVKPQVISPKPYSKNLPTLKKYKISSDKNFEQEKKRLIGFIQKTQTLGIEAFEGKEHFGFGKLSGKEWNQLFAKHLNHHLEQFGV